MGKYLSEKKSETGLDFFRRKADEQSVPSLQEPFSGAVLLRAS